MLPIVISTPERPNVTGTVDDVRRAKQISGGDWSEPPPVIPACTLLEVVRHQDGRSSTGSHLVEGIEVQTYLGVIH